MSAQVSLPELQALFHLSIDDAAEELGICATLLKKNCRHRGIKRWPHRAFEMFDQQRRDLDAIIASTTFPIVRFQAAVLTRELDALFEKIVYHANDSSASRRLIRKCKCFVEDHVLAKALGVDRTQMITRPSKKRARKKKASKSGMFFASRAPVPIAPAPTHPSEIDPEQLSDADVSVAALAMMELPFREYPDGC